MTLEMVPSGTISNLLVTNITANTVHLNWSAVLPMERRGLITSYDVFMERLFREWEDENSWLDDTYNIFETLNLNLSIVDLDNYTQYIVYINANTSQGAGPPSDFLSFETLQNVPSRFPPYINVIGSTSSSLNVSWTALPYEYHEGVLLGYKIAFEYVDSPEFEHRNGTLRGYIEIAGTDTYWYDIHWLEMFTNYTVKVAGYTSAGLGPWGVTHGKTLFFVDGNWTEWTKWGSCDKSCGLGKAMRQRWCTNPRPAAGGRMCPGESIQLEACNDNPCIGYYLSDFAQNCTGLCKGLGKEFACTRVMDLKNRIHAFYDSIDFSNYRKSANLTCTTNRNTDYFESETDPSLVTGPGVTNTGVCRGYRNMNRTNCDATGGQNIRRLCKCVDKDSAMFTEWANWGICSKDCGTGTYTRYRECLLSECAGKEVDSSDCNIDPCPIDGNWGQWTNYSSCTTNCGFGSRIRRRYCNNPTAEYGGAECVGVDRDGIEGCNPLPCPVHGQWGDWQPMEECKQPCGPLRYQLQRRDCDNPAPAYDGGFCVGNNTRSFPCPKTDCNTVDINYNIRFTKEEWDFTMYRNNAPKSNELKERIRENIDVVYINSSVPQTIDKYSLTFIHFAKGSVFVNFTITFIEISTIELVLLQDAIDHYGFIGSLPVQLWNITTNNIPSYPPFNITISSTISTINVSWFHVENRTSIDVINGQFYLYYVFFRDIDANGPWDNKGTPNNSVVIPGLKPATLYAIRVLVSTIMGNGVPSLHNEIRTQEGAPYRKPGNCEMLIIDDKTVYFSWEHLHPDDLPGFLGGYEISFWRYLEDDGTNPVIDTVEPSMTQRTINRFRSFKWYRVQITAFTGGGNGPPCIFIFETPPGAPGTAPPNATVEDRYSIDEMTLTWEFLRKEDENGDLSGYKFSYFITRIAGVDVGQQQVHEIDVDRFTKQYRITGLQSYTEYEIRLYAFSNYGDGPVIVLSGKTCKCPALLFTNFYEYKPFISVEVQDDVEEKAIGLFPELLSGIIKAVCTDCKSYKNPPLYYNRTMNGRSALKLNLKNAVLNIDEYTHFTFPIFGQLNIKTFSGDFPFVGIVQSQGSAMIVYQPKVVTIGFWAILSSVANAWSIVVVAVLITYLTGWLLWFAEQGSTNSDLDVTRALAGSAQGFWVSFISMTTLGYGDFVPSTFKAKIVMIIWVLAGLVIISIFGGIVSSGLSVGKMTEGIGIYGSTVAAIKDSFEYRKAILLNGIVHRNKTYTDIHDIMNAVASREVEVGLIDSSAALGFESEMEKMSLNIYKVLQYNTGFGIVLSGDAIRLETDIQSFVSSNQANIIAFVQQKIGVLKPTLIEVEELLLSPEESTSVIILLSYIFAGMSVAGYLRWKICSFRKKLKIAPQDSPQYVYNKFVEVHNYGSGFLVELGEKVAAIATKHERERIELNDMKKSYMRHMRRLGLQEEYQMTEKKIQIKWKRKLNIQRYRETTYDYDL